MVGRGCIDGEEQGFLTLLLLLGALLALVFLESINDKLVVGNGVYRVVRNLMQLGLDTA